jgi:hypothetical protein
MSKVYELIDLLNNEDFCDFLEGLAKSTGRTYSEVYDKVLDDNIYCGIVVDDYLRSRK